MSDATINLSCRQQKTNWVELDGRERVYVPSEADRSTSELSLPVNGPLMPGIPVELDGERQILWLAVRRRRRPCVATPAVPVT